MKKNSFIYIYIKRSVFLELNMSHDHHHHPPDAGTNTNTGMNHAKNMIQQQTSTSLGVSGHGSHTKDMMMTVSIRFTLIM